MPVTVEVEKTLYRFDELDYSAQERAMEQHNEHSLDYEWWESEYEYFVGQMEEFGVHIDQRVWTNSYGHSGSEPKINFSGFYSQGDGASFEASVDLDAWLKAMGLHTVYRSLYMAAQGRIEGCDIYKCRIDRTSSMYSHENTMYAEIEVWDSREWDNPSAKKVEEQAAQAQDDLQQWAREQAHGLWVTLRDEYEYLSGREYLTEYFRDHEYYFDEEGNYEGQGPL